MTRQGKAAKNGRVRSFQRSLTFLTGFLGVSTLVFAVVTGQTDPASTVGLAAGGTFGPKPVGETVEIVNAAGGLTSLYSLGGSGAAASRSLSRQERALDVREAENIVAEARSVYSKSPVEVRNSTPGVRLNRVVTEAMARISKARTEKEVPSIDTDEIMEALSNFELRNADYEELIAAVRKIGEDGDYAVQVSNLKTGASLVSINAHKQFVMASTYKLFVADAMIHEVEQGSWTWDDWVSGYRLSECFDKMIIESDNDCPEDWWDAAGTPVIEAARVRLGAVETVFAPQDLRTTAADLSRALQILHHGDEMTEESREKLLDAMKQQEYRDGIAAALDAKATVANKVGFLDSELHDAAIVLSPKGDFTFVILTENLSWEVIAEITTAIYDYL